MKLPESDIQTEGSKPLAEMDFGISNIGLIFEILRNKMYKDPIAAIAREYSCNARDAHREIGKPELPVLIQFPNAFNPTYKIQDFGPGISPDRMENVFIKYAASTKRADNSQTGGFGLGAKVGFSYSDTFTIITVVDKVKRTYHAYIDETRGSACEGLMVRGMRGVMLKLGQRWIWQELGNDSKLLAEIVDLFPKKAVVLANGPGNSLSFLLPGQIFIICPDAPSWKYLEGQDKPT